MLKSARITESLISAQTMLAKVRDPRLQTLQKVSIMLVSSNGELISSTRGHHTSDFSENIAAVATSLAVEYTAMDSLMTSAFTSFSWRTDQCLVVCCRLCLMKDGGSVFLIIALPDAVADDGRLNTALRLAAARLVQDWSPYLSPLLENMISGTSENE